MGLFRTILIIVLVYYGIRFISKLFLAAKIVSNSRKDHADSSTGASKEKKSPRQDDLGEYVDFEEIKD